MKLNKAKRIIAVVFLASVRCSSVTGCVQNNPRPENTIEEFQNAINNFDLDASFGCIDSKWSSQIEAICDFTVGEGEPSVSSFMSLINAAVPILPFASGGAIDPKDFPQVDFTILRTEISGDTASIVLSGLFTCGDCHKPFAATVEMQLKNGVWVIFGIR